MIFQEAFTHMLTHQGISLPSQHHDCLLQAADALDRLVWSYREEIDRCPKAFLTADDICLSDFAHRSAVLARRLIGKGSDGRGGPSPFPSLSPAKQARLRYAIEARRATEKDAAHTVSSDVDVSQQMSPSSIPQDEHTNWQRADQALPPDVDDLGDNVRISPSHSSPRPRLH